MNPQNLKPFPKGTSGNPNGRPKIPEDTKKAKEVLREANETLAIELIKSGKYQSLMIEAMEQNAKSGKFDFARFLNDYNDNKPKDSLDVKKLDNTFSSSMELTLEEEVEIIRELRQRIENKKMVSQLTPDERLEMIEKLKQEINIQ